jgi:lipid-A-disaccharide synthase
MTEAPGSTPGPSRRILVVTGEASGDRHAAGLVREALAIDPRLTFTGIGGRHLREAGVELLMEASEISVVGISEVLDRLPAIREAMARIKRVLRTERFDAVLLVDFPDFNLHVAGRAVAAGVPVVYFISPQVWAWRRRRVSRIRRLVRRMIVLFPFEEEFYRAAGVPVTFSGHPLAGYGGPTRSPEAARRRLGLPPDGPVFGLLPGSRIGEVNRHLDLMLEAAQLVSERMPGATFLIPIADTVASDRIADAATSSTLPVVAMRDAFDPITEACDAALAASGTATLELAVRGVPPVVVYRTSPATYLVGRLAVRVPHVSLVNLIAGRRLVPELIQSQFTARRAADELVRLATPGPEREAILAGLDEVRGALGPPDAYRRAAEALLEELGEAHTGATGANES